jgi:hypothetical protein
MKITLNFKTPDVTDCAFSNIEDEDEKDAIANKLRGWIRYGEMLTVEYDTETDAMSVVRVRN